MQAAEQLTLMLDWFINPDHAPVIIAREKGFFRATGWRSTSRPRPTRTTRPSWWRRSRPISAVSYQPQLQLQVEEGLPLLRDRHADLHPLELLVVLQDGPVKSIADLKGRKVGFSVGGFEDAILGAMLGEAGLKIGDVELVNVNFSLSPALIAGQVDAVIGAYRNFELSQLAIDGRPGRAFYPEEKGVPAFDELIYVAHKDRLDRPGAAALPLRHRARDPLAREPPGGGLGRVPPTDRRSTTSSTAAPGPRPSRASPTAPPPWTMAATPVSPAS